MRHEILLDDMLYIKSKIDNIDQFNGTSLLITGCAGFLGFYFLSFFTHFVDHLSIKSIICIDNFKLGKPMWLQMLVDKHKGKLKLYNFDVAKDIISDIYELKEADFIIHMASIASPTFYRRYPIETIDANVWGLRKLLDFFKNKKIKGFLFFSSSEVYGDPLPEYIPTFEEYRGNTTTIGPRACYDESKRFGETICYLYADKYKLPITIVRPFNNFGPGMLLDDKRVPADFAKAIIENNDIVIYSDGSPSRTFCYVADAITGYLKALLFGSFEYFNIGIDKPEISVKEFAEIYIAEGKNIFAYTGKIVFKEHHDKSYLTHNPNRRCPNISKARKLLNYVPSIGVNEGVSRFLYFLKATNV